MYHICIKAYITTLTIKINTYLFLCVHKTAVTVGAY